MKKMARLLVTSMTLGCASLVVLFLVNCGVGGDKKLVEGDIVLLKINDRPVIGQTEFFKELGAMVGKMDPTLLPKATQRKVMDDLARFEATVEAAKRESIDKDPEFVKIYEEQKQRLKKVALVRFYDKKKFETIQVSDAEKKAYFEENKARFVKEQGGVLLYGVRFDKRDNALNFYERVKKENAENFASIGKQEKAGTFREFGRVGKEAANAGYGYAVPVAIRTAALKLTKLPGVDVVKDAKDAWVIHVSDKKDEVLYDYAEIEERLGNQLRVNKFMENRNKMYDDLKKQFKVEINEEFFKEPEKPVQEESTSSKEKEERAPQADESNSNKEVM